jgi:ankyrin repeat protein
MPEREEELKTRALEGSSSRFSTESGSSYSLKIPIRIKSGSINDEALQIVTSTENRNIPWGAVEYICLGAIDECISASDGPKSNMRNVIRKLFFGEKTQDDSAKPAMRTQFILDIYVRDQEAAYRFDSTNINYKAFLGDVSYVSFLNFKKLVKLITDHARNSYFNRSLLALLQKKNDKVHHYNSFYDFELECQNNRSNLDREVHWENLGSELDYNTRRSMEFVDIEDNQEIPEAQFRVIESVVGSCEEPVAEKKPHRQEEKPGDSSQGGSIFTASKEGDIDALTRIITGSAEASIADENGYTVLMHACMGGSREAVGFLLDRGADLNTRSDAAGRTALMLACWEGHPEAASMLLDAGAGIDERDSEGRTALMLACWQGHTEAAKLLISRGADIRSADEKGATPLIHATLENREDIVRLLIDAGADPEARDESGRHALHLAAQAGHLDVLKILVEKGMDVNSQDSNGATALLLACINDAADILRHLTEHGADLNRPDLNNTTPLMLSTGNESTEILEILISGGANLDMQDNSGLTALMFAVASGNIEAAKMLVNAGADIGKKNSDGIDAEAIASARELDDVVEFLRNYRR